MPTPALDLSSRLARGDLAAWDDPQAALELVEGDTHLLQGAMKAVVQGSCSEVARSLLPLWWAHEWSASSMLGYLSHRALQAGQGSREHRRWVLLSCLLARCVSHCPPHDYREAGEAMVEHLEAWALHGVEGRPGGRFEVHARTLRATQQELAGSKPTARVFRLAVYIHLADTADVQAPRATRLGSSVATLLLFSWNTSSLHCNEVLTDLIRAVLPEVT